MRKRIITAYSHVFDQPSRCADIEHVDPAGILLGAGSREPPFHGHERAGLGGAIVCRAAAPVSQSRPLGKSTANRFAAAALS